MEIINVSYPNDGLGDKLRDSMVKVNDNFNELLGLINSLDLSISGITGLDDALNTISASITGLQSQINTLDSNHTTDISTINSNVITINSSIATINDSIADIINQLEPLLEYNEPETLQTVTNRGMTTSNSITIGGMKIYDSVADFYSEISVNDGVFSVDAYQGRLLNCEYGYFYFKNTDGYLSNISNASLTSNRLYTLPNKSGTFALLDDIVAPTLQSTLLDSNLGTRLTPISSTINGFNLNKSVNGSVGFVVKNTDGTGNGAIASVSVGGTGSYYENGLSLTYYGGGYYIPSLRKTGGLYSTQDFNFLNVNNSKIDFKTGTTISDVTSKFSISGGGTVSIGVTPLTDNSVVKGLARKSNGDLVEFDRTCFFTQVFMHGSVSPLDNTTYYIGNFPDLSPNTSNSITRRIHSQGKGYVSSVSIAINIGGTIGSTENSTFELHNLTQETFVKITSQAVHNTDSLILYTLSSNLNVKEEDELQIRWITPAWVTNPTTVRQRFTIKINIV
ncbi:hypothetical protein [Flavobacterium sp.]|uniref:hypothetical protein n=1 Tax=Flavobacterium sp. TaxID=239 RepID=UPI002FDE3D02